MLSWCFTSTEARWPVRDRDRVGRGRQSEGSTDSTHSHTHSHTLIQSRCVHTCDGVSVCMCVNGRC